MALPIVLGQRRVRIDVHGAVQGAAYRWFGYRLATELGTSGDARNVGGSAPLRAADIEESIANFVACLRVCVIALQAALDAAVRTLATSS